MEILQIDHKHDAGKPKPSTNKALVGGSENKKDDSEENHEPEKKPAIQTNEAE